MDITQHSNLYKSFLKIIDSLSEIPWFENVLAEYKIGLLTSKLTDLFKKYDALKLVSLFEMKPLKIFETAF